MKWSACSLLIIIFSFRTWTSVADRITSEVTYCWSVNASPSKEAVRPKDVSAQGEGDSCPLYLQLSTSDLSFTEDESMMVTWSAIPNQSEEDKIFSLDQVAMTNSPDKDLSDNVIRSQVHLCASDTDCSILNQDLLSFPSTVNVHRNLTQTGNGNYDTEKFGPHELALKTSGKFKVMAHLVLAAKDSNLRYEIASYLHIAVDGSKDTSTEHSEGNELLYFNLIVLGTLAVVIVMGTVCFTLFVHKEQKESPDQLLELGPGKHSDGASCGEYRQSNLSPIPRRKSHWTDLYATQDALPASILDDSNNTRAILRDSRVSSPTESPELATIEFHQTVTYWDVQPNTPPQAPNSDDSNLLTLHESPPGAFPGHNTMIPLSRPSVRSLTGSREETSA